MNQTDKHKVDCQMSDIDRRLRDKLSEILQKDYCKLEFGCKFNVFGLERIVLEKRGDEISNFLNGVVFTNSEERIKSSPNIEIIGAEPTLNDIFSAMMIINGGGLTHKDDWGISVGNYDVAKLLDRYDLSKSLYNQTQEAKEWILGVLNK